MANVTSTTNTFIAIFMTLNKPERIAGASPGDKLCYIATKDIDDASVTPKENDWMLDVNSVTWIVKGWRRDPLQAMTVFWVRKA